MHSTPSIATPAPPFRTAGMTASELPGIQNARISSQTVINPVWYYRVQCVASHQYLTFYTTARNLHAGIRFKTLF